MRDGSNQFTVTGQLVRSRATEPIITPLNYGLYHHWRLRYLNVEETVDMVMNDVDSDDCEENVMIFLHTAVMGIREMKRHCAMREM